MRHYRMRQRWWSSLKSSWDKSAIKQETMTMKSTTKTGQSQAEDEGQTEQEQECKDVYQGMKMFAKA